MQYSQNQKIRINFIFSYEDIRHLLNSMISFIVKNYNQPNDSNIRIYVTSSKGQSFSFLSLEDFVENFSRTNYIDSVSLDMFFDDPSNKKESISVRSHFISNILVELNVSSTSQTLTQDLIDGESKIISHYIDENHPLKTKPTILSKVDNILSNSKLAYMIIGAIITGVINLLVKLFAK